MSAAELAAAARALAGELRRRKRWGAKRTAAAEGSPVATGPRAASGPQVTGQAPAASAQRPGAATTPAAGPASAPSAPRPTTRPSQAATPPKAPGGTSDAPRPIPKPTIRRTDLPASNPAAMDMAGLRRSIDTCMACSLSAGAMGSGALPGRGARKPRLLFVTDFAGPAERNYQKVLAPELGQMLQRITTALGVQPSEIYLTSAVKCPLPGGSLPKPTEVEACSSWLRRELELIDPAAIVAFGATATRALFGPAEEFEALRGRLLSFNKVPAIVTQPPRDMHADPSLKARAWTELQLLGPALGLDPA